MIFGFGQYPVTAAASAQSSRCGAVNDNATPTAESDARKAQIYDLAHERRLRALHSYIEQGYTLSEAARRIGVSTLTVHRWDDHGRR
jgi:transposase-like protein